MRQPKKTPARPMCVPCEGRIRRLSAKEITAGLRKLPDWRLLPGRRAIRTDCRARDFMGAVRMIRRIARIAETAGHHPDLHLTGYRHLAVELSTHSIGGLSANDFILASKIARILPLERRRPA